jgi:hypothetical protein
MDSTDKEVLALESLPLPDIRALGRIPSLPPWAVSLNNLIKDLEQRSTKNGKFRIIPTLPATALPNPKQREMLEGYVAEVDMLCGQTPETNIEYEKPIFSTLVEFILLFPALRQQGEAAIEALGKAYLLVVKDIAYSATLRAVELWTLGEAGCDERGEPYIYRWPPAPADLRRIAKVQECLLSHSAFIPRRLLAAEARAELSDEHRAKMLERLASLKSEIGS